VTTKYGDWRITPDPLPCATCNATLGGCQNRQNFRARPCCARCEHHPTDDGQTAA
jgi:hypothetical protein